VADCAEAVQEAHQVVLAEKPAIRETTSKLSPEVRDELLRQLSTLASVYHKLPASFVKVRRAKVHRAEDLEAARQQRSAEDGDDIILPEASGGDAAAGSAGVSGDVVAAAASGGASGVVSSDTAPTATDGGIDLLGGLDEPAVCILDLCSGHTHAVQHAPYAYMAFFTTLLQAVTVATFTTTFATHQHNHHHESIVLWVPRMPPPSFEKT
jgi:hypothetical protein